jgi:uncharacterized repeat protein (TIGR01451 family)
MNGRTLFKLAIVFGLLVILSVGLAGLVQTASAAPAQQTSRTSDEVERILIAPAHMAARPRPGVPPSLPPGGPLLQTPALTLTKWANPDVVNAGDVLTYTITVYNSDSVDATGLVITDRLDTRVDFASASDGGTYDSGSGVVTWNADVITAGRTITRSLWVTVSQVSSGTTLSNTANVTSTEGLHDDDTVNTLVQASADLSISKTDDPDSVIAGNQLTYEVEVTNNGPSDAVNVRVTDTLPDGVAFNSTLGCDEDANGVPTCSLGDIPVGQSKSYTIHVTVAPDTLGTIENTATVSSDTPDPDSAHNSVSESTLVEANAALSITKSDDPHSVIAGDPLTYEMEVTNNGPSDAVNVRVTDALPDGVTFDSTIGCQGPGSGVPICSLGEIPVGQSKTYTIQVTVDSDTLGTILNSAQVIANTPGGGAIATASTQVQAEADLTITKNDSPDPVVAGDQLTYQVQVTNDGPSDASGVTVTDTLSAGLTFNASGSSNECDVVGQQVTCDIGDLPANTTLERIIVVDVAASLTHGLQLNNTAWVSGDQTDPVDNNFSSQGTTVHRKADLGVSLTDSTDPVGIGGSFTYHITVTNNGPSNASDVVVTDTLPTGLSFKSSGSSSGCVLGGGQVTCTVGNLAAGHEVILAVAVDVDDSLADGTLLSNTVAVSANEEDLNGGNDSATEDTLSVVLRTYLPIIIRSMTELSVFNDNTGGNVSFTVVGAGVTCVVPNNTTQFCGNFVPGTYTVRVSSVCGQAEAVKTYQSGPVTTRVYCK